MFTVSAQINLKLIQKDSINNRVQINSLTTLILKDCFIMITLCSTSLHGEVDMFS